MGLREKNLEDSTMHYLTTLLLSVSLVLVSGCNPATKTTEKPEVRLKRILENVAQVGDISPVKQDVETIFAQLKADSPAKASAIEKEMQSLLQLKHKNQIKEKAGQIATLL